MGRDTFLGKVQAVKKLYLAYLFAEAEIFLIFWVLRIWWKLWMFRSSKMHVTQIFTSNFSFPMSRVPNMDPL